MRAISRPLSTHTVFSPIETVISVFVLATLAYFHILSGIKHSSFFASSQPPALRPAYARLTNGEWVAVSRHEWAEAWKHPGGNLDALELQQLVFTVDDKAQAVSSKSVLLLRSHARVLRRNLHLFITCTSLRRAPAWCSHPFLVVMAC